MSGYREFDLTAELPTGLHALEASAGTGKTYALSALAVRFVAERAVRASGLCVVSFTEAATAELRGRIRARLVEAQHHLELGPDAPRDDPVLDALNPAALADDERTRRLANVRAALAEFDEATIATIHGFCSRVVAASDPTASAIVVDDGRADVDEVANDLFLARHGDEPDTTIDPERVADAARTLLSMPRARLWCPPEPTKAAEANRRRFREAPAAATLVEAVVDEVRRRRAARRRRSFDDLLTQACDALDDPGAVAALRQRYAVVLIDEFQDTDHLQWDVFRRAFVDPGPVAPTVVLVGDPKQSIYRFRSADLHAYVAARHQAGDRVGSLATSWRSDAPLLRSLEHVLSHVSYGSDDVRFHPVGHAPGHERLGLDGAGPESLEIRCIEPSGDGPVRAGEARRVARADLVGTVDRLLAGGATLPDGRGGRRPLAAGDVAVLVRSNRDATQTALDLAAHGIAAATASATSVLDTDAAQHWHLLLRSLEQPAVPGWARAAAFSWFLGRDAQWLADADDDALAELHDLLRDWAATLAGQGLARLLHRAQEAGLHERLLATPGGERRLTDLEHIAELLQRTTGGRPASASTFLAALRDLEATATEEASRDALSRRIDRDDDAVQILTVHRSKGLEFPVVLLPYAWVGGSAGRGIPHAHLQDEGRCLDASWITRSPKLAANTPVRAGADEERTGEAARLLYVALTRARHRCVVWWVPPTTAADKQPLARALRLACGSETAPRLAADLSPLVEAAGGTIVANPALGHAPARRPGSDLGPEPNPLAVASADRAIDRSWRTWSFSALAAIAGHGAGASTDAGPAADTDATAAPEAGAHDEAHTHDPAEDPRVAAPTVVPEPTGEPDLWAQLPAGARFGTLVHAILERTDFTHPQLAEHLRDVCHHELRHQHVVDPDRLASVLLPVLHTPLGGPAGARRLADVPRSDRLDELTFHFPLGRCTARQIGAVLAEHLPADDLLAPWARAVAESRSFHIEMSGLLHGSIDLVSRTGSYWVADYKTNRLASRDYRPAQLAQAMAQAHYPLQAIIYLVALHRFLRWRWPAYHPHHHLGGAAYLFLRGMRPDAARGVFWWQPPADAVLAVDAMLGTDEPMHTEGRR